jgi:hypothetical protein
MRELLEDIWDLLTEKLRPCDRWFWQGGHEFGPTGLCMRCRGVIQFTEPIVVPPYSEVTIGLSIGPDGIRHLSTSEPRPLEDP